jgi:hypothetical protein
MRRGPAAGGHRSRTPTRSPTLALKAQGCPPLAPRRRSPSTRMSVPASYPSAPSYRESDRALRARGAFCASVKCRRHGCCPPELRVTRLVATRQPSEPHPSVALRHFCVARLSLSAERASKKGSDGASDSGERTRRGRASATRRRRQVGQVAVGDEQHGQRAEDRWLPCAHAGSVPRIRL